MPGVGITTSESDRKMRRRKKRYQKVREGERKAKEEKETEARQKRAKQKLGKKRTIMFPGSKQAARSEAAKPEAKPTAYQKAWAAQRVSISDFDMMTGRRIRKKER